MPDTTLKNPLDAERERLRAKGWNDERIDKILMDAEIQALAQRGHSQAGAAGFGGGVGVQGVWTGALNNLNVALAHARAFLPSIAADIANLFGGHKSLEVRSQAGVFLVAKLVFVGVLGFAVYQEWQQHIIYGTETARQQALKAAEDTEIAKNQAAITGGQVPAAVNKAIGAGAGPTVRELLPSLPSSTPSAQALPPPPSPIAERGDFLKARIDSKQATRDEVKEYAQIACRHAVLIGYTGADPQGACIADKLKQIGLPKKWERSSDF